MISKVEFSDGGFGSVAHDENGKIRTYNDWLNSVQYYRTSDKPEWKAMLGDSTINDDSATVDVIINVFRAGDLFVDPVSEYDIVFVLVKMDNSWLIESPTYIYWIY